jgi:S-adenosylmethionine:tRNA ribosyltransferase-isomerase
MTERLADYDYELPAGRIAARPADRRDASRLLVLPRGGGPVRHRTFGELETLVAPGDLLVVNESRVLPARLLGRKPTGARAEILLTRPLAPGVGDGAAAPPQTAAAFSAACAEAREWEALVRPGSKLKPGRVVDVAPGLRVEIIGPAPGGMRTVRLLTDLPVAEALDRYGHLPLPPYIERDDDAADRERYQTVYAGAAGSIAAPTAGLHFTPELLDRLAARGVRRAAVTLHVGVGTFRPVETDDPAEHEMHAEIFNVPESTAAAVAETRAGGGRVWAVGTTVVRTLESVPEPGGRVRAGSGSTDLYIRPGFDFKVVDALITNFHLPRSTLLMLVSAFAGHRPVMDAYREAVQEGYRFYSYGDAMALVPAGGGAAPGGATATHPTHPDGEGP